MRIEQVAPDFLVAIGQAYAANAAVLFRGGEALLVDAMGSAADAEELRRLVEDEHGKQVRTIVCTHYFADHLAALRLFPRAEIVAHELYKQTFRAERHRTAEEEAHFVEPTMVIGDRARIRWGRFTLDVFHNPGHTMSTVGIDVAEADLIFVGDTIVGNLVYLAYSEPELFAAALDRLDRRGRGRLLSSHGGVRSSQAITNAKTYLARLRERAVGSDDDAVRAIPMEACLADGVAPTEFERIFHRRNLDAIIERQLFAN